jgi:Flp pilus assembly protein TadD
VSRAPFDLNYLHALGLAYAQVGRFERARTTLDKAISIAPTHRQLAESRALVDQMAKAQQP